MNNPNHNGQSTGAQWLALLNSRDQIDLRQYWFILWRRKWWVIVPGFIITCCSIAYALFFVRSIYEASTTLQVGSSRLLNRSVREVIPGASGGVNAYELTRKILGSNYLSQLIQRLELTKDEKAMREARSLHSRNPSLSIDELLERVLLEALRKNISVTMVQGGELFHIAARHESPQMAYYLSKTLAEIFIDESKRNELRGIRGAMEFSEEQLAIYKAKADESEEKLRKLKERITSSQVKNAGLTTEQFLKLRELKNSIDIAISDKQQRLAQLQKTVPSSSRASLWDGDAELSRLRSRMNERLDDFRMMASTTTWQDNSEIMLNNDLHIMRQEGHRLLAEVIARQYPGFDAATRQTILEYQSFLNDLHILQARAKVTGDVLKSFEQQATTEPSVQLELRRFEDELEQNRRVYRMFFEQSRGSQIEEALQHSDADFKYSIVEPARVPIFAVGGSKRNFVVVGFLASLAVGLALVVGLEFLDQTIRSVEDVEKYLQLPVWGIVPKMSAPFSSWNAAFKEVTEEAPSRRRPVGNNGSPEEPDSSHNLSITA